jgi:hypothetical protein
VPRSVHVGFVLDKGVEQVLHSDLKFSPANIIPPWLSILTYHLGDYKRHVGGRCSDVFSAHLHEQHNVAAREKL